MALGVRLCVDYCIKIIFGQKWEYVVTIDYDGYIYLITIEKYRFILGNVEKRLMKRFWWNLESSANLF